MNNTKHKSKRFLLPILSLVLLSIISIAFVSSYISINIFKVHMKEHIEEAKSDYTKRHKEKVYNDVKIVSDAIDFQIKQMEDRLKKSLKEKINVALDVANYVYNNYKDTHTKEEIKAKIAKELSVIKFNENRGYYFMYDNKTKVLFGHPMKKFIGKDMNGFKDAKGRNLMQTDAEILKKDKIGFNKIYFNKPGNPNEQFPKITCISIFEPLDLVIGIGEYLDEVERQTKELILKKFSQDNFNTGDRYIVILDVHNMDGGDGFATVLLNSNRPDLVGNKVSDKGKDVKGNRFRKNFLDLIKKDGEGYSVYWYKKPTTKVPAKKVSYIYFQKDWNWIILNGFYYEDLDKQISQMEESIITQTNDLIYRTLIWVALLSILAILIAILVSIKIDRTIKQYTNTIIEYEDNKRKQEQLLIQQSKMAAMGEMIGNIAHQWRQPLSAISTASTGARIQKDMDCLSDSQLDSALVAINESAQYLSKTIDDFRGFFSPSNNKVSEFNIIDTIDKTLNIINSQFTAKDIELIKKMEECEILSIENELVQVLINILNNAKDAILNTEYERRLIFISTYKKDDSLIIEIQDNGNGIEEKIIDRIFEPYFTTKHKSQGTGIGLFMSEEIVRTRLKGSIIASNETYTYEDVEYKGAMFTISLPLD